jgi:hypothetical protein
MTNEELLSNLHKELDEGKATLTEIRRRISNPEEVPDSEVTFHQEVLVKIQKLVWEIERDIEIATKTTEGNQWLQ